jgi:hypothetical protein
LDTHKDFAILEPEDSYTHAQFEGMMPAASIPARIKTVIDHYELAISNQFSLEKLVTLIQTLIRIHGFQDGNCRVFCMLVLNKELMRHRQSPAILSSYDAFAGLSQAEMVAQITHGQALVKELAESEGRSTIFDGKSFGIWRSAGNDDACFQCGHYVTRDTDITTRLLSAALMYQSAKQLQKPKLTQEIEEVLLTERRQSLATQSIESTKTILSNILKYFDRTYALTAA